MNAPHHHRVMFVDDEEGVRASWNRLLGERGFDVRTATDGREAISQLSAETVDVVVADLRMPGLDGLQLLQWVHDRRPETPFILLTGYGSEEVERQARQLGAYEYLNKPISPETLAAVITAASRLGLTAQAAGTAAGTEAPAATRDAAVAGKERTALPSGDVEAAPVERRAKAGRTGVREVLEVGGSLVAAPLLGLAFVMFLPLIGFAAFFWYLGERIWKGKEVPTT